MHSFKANTNNTASTSLEARVKYLIVESTYFSTHILGPHSCFIANISACRVATRFLKMDLTRSLRDASKSAMIFF